MPKVHPVAKFLSTKVLFLLFSVFSEKNVAELDINMITEASDSQNMYVFEPIFRVKHLDAHGEAEYPA